MRILLCQIDGKIPNLALMRIAAYHRGLGDYVELCHGASFESRLLGAVPDKVYGSCIFTKSRDTVKRLLVAFPDAIIGGTGWDIKRTIQDVGVPAGRDASDLDYSLYPKFRQSIGFTQRGCRLRCSFCVVPEKEGSMRPEHGIYSIWRKDPWPRELILLDNDFFGNPGWRLLADDIRNGGFKVSFNQGINARFLTDEAAETIASLDYRDDNMTVKRIYTAWDNRKDEHRLFAGLNRLVRYGVKPDHIMVYVLIGYWPGETTQDRLYRIEKLLDFGCRPFPMAYRKDPELDGMQRWAIGAYAKRKDESGNRTIPWPRWEAAKYRPENLRPEPTFPLLEVLQ
jgi:hypothetical protein